METSAGMPLNFMIQILNKPLDLISSTHHFLKKFKEIWFAVKTALYQWVLSIFATCWKSFIRCILRNRVFMKLHMVDQMVIPQRKRCYTKIKTLKFRYIFDCQWYLVFEAFRGCLLSADTTVHVLLSKLQNSYTTVCPPVCGDNPQALASGISPRLDKMWSNYFILPSSV